MLVNLILVISNLLQSYFLFIGLFYLFLSIAAILIKKETPSANPGNRFAVIVPAYNEERTIKFTIESLKKQNYPEKLFSIFVIADGCTDRTAEIAEKEGARVLLRRREENTLQSKGAALKWGTEKILKDETFTAFCYFDADSLAHPDFLKRMNDHLNTGEKVIQGRQLAKNTGGWLERILAVGHLISNIFFQSPKYALGMSATLHGKGIVFSRDLINKYQWDEDCLTEDLEMQMRLITDGVRITWAREAVIYDEEPSRISQYIRRSVRWTRGSLDVARKHLFNLIKRAFCAKDIKAIEGAIYSLNAYRLSLVFLTSVLAFYTKDNFNIIIWLYRALPGSELTLKFLNFLPLFLYPLAVLVKERFDLKMTAAYFMQPTLGILRIPVFISGVFQDRRTWLKTTHESKIRIGDIIQEE